MYCFIAQACLFCKSQKRIASRRTNIQEEQFLSFFQNRNNVVMSSYHTDSKGSPILYLRDQKNEMWRKFYETYPDGMKRTSFMARLADSENLKYRQDLGGLCMICHDYGYDTFDNLENIICSNSTDKNFIVSK